MLNHFTYYIICFILFHIRYLYGFVLKYIVLMDLTSIIIFPRYYICQCQYSMNFKGLLRLINFTYHTAYPVIHSQARCRHHPTDGALQLPTLTDRRRQCARAGRFMKNLCCYKPYCYLYYGFLLFSSNLLGF